MDLHILNIHADAKYIATRISGKLLLRTVLRKLHELTQAVGRSQNWLEDTLIFVDCIVGVVKAKAVYKHEQMIIFIYFASYQGKSNWANSLQAISMWNQNSKYSQMLLRHCSGL